MQAWVHFQQADKRVAHIQVGVLIQTQSSCTSMLPSSTVFASFLGAGRDAHAWNILLGIGQLFVAGMLFAGAKCGRLDHGGSGKHEA